MALLMRLRQLVLVRRLKGSTGIAVRIIDTRLDDVRNHE